jgi:serine beta-lactamase-like protein LACTB
MRSLAFVPLSLALVLPLLAQQPQPSKQLEQQAQKQLEKPAEPRPLPKLAALDACAKKGMESQQLVGLAMGVIVDGKVVHVRGFGFADREAKKPVDERTMFRWASISKPLTAMRAMQLVEQGKLDLDAEVREYVPEFPKKPHFITTRQLLGHLGGIVHYRNGVVIRSQVEYESPHPFADVVVALDTFKESPLIAEPGTKYAYSTHGFILAGAVVQKAGGAPFAEQIREHIAAPLGMKSLRPDYQWEKIPGRAVGYRKQGKEIVRSTDTDVSWKLPGGGYISDIRDLSKLGAEWTQRRLLKPESYAELLTPQRTKGGKRTNYGLGFALRPTRVSATGPGSGANPSGPVRVSKLQFGHSGAQEKARSYLWVDREERLGIALMSNSEYAKLAPLVQDLMKELKELAAKR